MQLLFTTLLPCLTGKPFDGFNVIIVTNVSTITVFLWASNQMITLINSSLYVIAASNNLLVLHKKERQENFIYCTNFCVLNFIFSPWPHQPASHLTYWTSKMSQVIQKSICRSFSNFAVETFGAKQFFLVSKKLQHEEIAKIGKTWFSPPKTTYAIWNYEVSIVFYRHEVTWPVYLRVSHSRVC